MIDIGRNNRPAARHFVADKLRRDKLRDRCAKTVAGMGRGHCRWHRSRSLLPADIFPDRDVFHLRGDDALPGIMHLLDVTTGFGAQNRPARCVGKTLGLRRVGLAVLYGGLIAGAGQFLDIAARTNPILAAADLSPGEYRFPVFGSVYGPEVS